MANSFHWGSFDWEDPFLFNQQLTDEEQMVRESVAKYAQEKLAPRVINMYREEGIDRSIFQEMGELGLLGPMIDGYGCAGMSYTAYGLIAREVERIDLSLIHI